MLTEKERMEHQLELLNDIIENRRTRKELRAKRDYFINELAKLDSRPYKGIHDLMKKGR